MLFTVSLDEVFKNILSFTIYSYCVLVNFCLFQSYKEYFLVLSFDKCLHP